MFSTEMRHPDKIFATEPPPPPPWPTPLAPSQVPSSSIRWRKDETDGMRLVGVLSRLQGVLRRSHKRKISWPVEELASSSGLSHEEYLTMLLRPLASVCNQLHDPSVVKTPMDIVNIDLGPSVWAATFAVEDFKRCRLPARLPIILSTPSDYLFQPNGDVSPSVASTVTLALEHTPAVPIIATNFKEIAVFRSPDFHRSEHTFKRISTSQPVQALRVLSLGYLLETRLGFSFIPTPSPDLEIDVSVVLPYGPPQNPLQPLLADEEVFATHHRTSDFDRATLVRDRARALQFFRWHRHVRSSFSKLVAHPKDTLSGKTHETGQIKLDFRPIYPFVASEVPLDTQLHLQETRREAPLVTAGVAELFERSKSFKLDILAVISEGTERGIRTVYSSKITSVDDVPISTPPLCLKLFDDQFKRLEYPSEDDELNDETLPRWFDRVVSAETEALKQAFAYDKLLPVQGSVVPWFYGTHQFTLPYGTVLYGLLMEYIEGWKLDSEYVRDLSAARQAKVIQSCRHAARLLDIADIAQWGWHEGKMILTTNPTTKLDHAVLIDFSSTTQTWVPEEMNFINNYFGMFHTLLDRRRGGVALDSRLVWKYYGEPDDWDPVVAVIPTTNAKGRKGTRIVESKTLFPYISLV